MLPGMQHMTGDNLDTHSVLHLREDHRPGSAQQVRGRDQSCSRFISVSVKPEV